MRRTGTEQLSIGTPTANGNRRWLARSRKRSIEATPRSGPTTTTWIIRAASYLSQEQALEAAGLRE